MIRSKLLALLTLTLFLPTLIFAQLEVAWEKPLSAELQWQQITALGNLITCTPDALQRIDAETGELIWSNVDLANLPQEAFNPIAGSPFFKVSRMEELVQSSTWVETATPIIPWIW